MAIHHFIWLLASLVLLVIAIYAGIFYWRLTKAQAAHAPTQLFGIVLRGRAKTILTPGTMIGVGNVATDVAAIAFVASLVP